MAYSQTLSAGGHSGDNVRRQAFNGKGLTFVEVIFENAPLFAHREGAGPAPYLHSTGQYTHHITPYCSWGHV